MSPDSPLSSLINRFNTVIKIASAQNEDFPDELCDFLSEQYQLQGVVLFSIEGSNNDLMVLGKSKNAKKAYLNGTKVNCSICKLINSGENGLNTDAKCELQVSEFLVYESCYKFDLFDGTKAFLKLAKKTPFNQDDLTDLNQVSDLIDHLWKVWKGNDSQSSLSSAKPQSDTPSEFSKIVVSTGNELRGPINTIVGFTSILSEDNLTSSQSENVSTIKQNAHDLLLSVNDLIDLAKLESGNISVKNKSISIKSMLEDIVDLFKNKKENASNTIALNFEGDIPDRIEIDDQKLRYVLNNILMFSSKLTTNGSINIIVTGKPEGGLQFSVTDSGIGVSPDVKVDVFKPFKLSSIDKLRHTTLSALGFTLVKEYVKFFGGVIKFESTQGQGSSITFSLFKDKVTVLEENITKIPQPVPNADNSVLVIEDDYASQKILKTNLEKWGYTPELVSSPEDIFTFLDKKTYLAIILNIEIPNANGLELVQQIRKHPKCKGTPIIVMSVDTEQQKAFMMGPVEYFVKPINYNFLVETLTSFKLRQNSNVLCVDDDIPTMNLIKQAIETAGFNAVAENISANVMDLIQDKDIDLAIIDLDMPHPNGFELIKLIKSSPKFANLPICQLLFTREKRITKMICKKLMAYLKNY
ncbi:MAG: response regulator [Melioribacteraceae bacterium]|nr:response regulator [Melioribacteraceae bacterium]MCF8265936.1 response regulator [Melioribacteraceae bacterium]